MTDFEEIEAKRIENKISLHSLCQEAKIHEATYRRRRREPAGGQAETIRKLNMALNYLIGQRTAAGWGKKQ